MFLLQLKFDSGAALSVNNAWTNESIGVEVTLPCHCVGVLNSACNHVSTRLRRGARIPPQTAYISLPRLPNVRMCVARCSVVMLRWEPEGYV